MATGATGTLTKELRIELKFITDGFKRQTQDAANGLKDLNQNFKKTATSAERARGQTDKFVSVLKAYIGLNAGKKALDIALAFDRIENRLKFATSSVGEFNQALEFTSDTANQLGLSLIDTQRGFSTIAAAAKGSSLEGQPIIELFKGVSQAAAALSLTADETNSVFTAFGQIISKGTVQAEELRGQIGERLPQAIQASARALGVTERELGELLRLGAITADDLLPKLAKEFQNTFGEQAVKNASSLTATVNRLTNEFKLFIKALSDASLEDSGFTKSLNAISESLSKIRAGESSIASEVNSGLAGEPTIFKNIREYLGLSNDIQELGDPLGDSLKLNLETIKDLNNLTERVPTLSNLLGLDTTETDAVSKELDEVLVKQRELREEFKKDQLAKNAATATIGVFNGVNKAFDLLEKGINIVKPEIDELLKLEPTNPFSLLNEEAQQAFAEAGKQRLLQRTADEQRVKDLKKQLDLLKEQEKQLQGGSGQVNFLQAIQRGSDADIKLNIQTRSRALGANDGSKKLLEENLQEQKNVVEQLELLNEKLDVERA